jgi:hypothetical protein
MSYEYLRGPRSRSACGDESMSEHLKQLGMWSALCSGPLYNPGKSPRNTTNKISVMFRLSSVKTKFTKLRDAEEDGVIMSSITCTVHQTLLERSNQEG